MAHGIILLGANGAGKSTLGRELANVLNFAHFYVEDYCVVAKNIAERFYLCCSRK